MINYNIYQKSDNYLISYHVEDNKIIKKYDNDKTEHAVPLNKHNIEVCERQLQKELYEVIKSIKLEIKNIKLYSLSLLPGVVITGITGHYILSVIGGFLFLRNISILKTDSFILKDINLSIFCLENIEKIKKITANNHHYNLPLTKTSIEVLDSDNCLTYNNIHNCTYNDLKILKKTITKYYGE